jgi:hypothetical protein
LLSSPSELKPKFYFHKTQYKVPVLYRISSAIRPIILLALTSTLAVLRPNIRQQCNLLSTGSRSAQTSAIILTVNLQRAAQY